MSEHRTVRYPAATHYNAQVLVGPINARLLDAGWAVVSSVWSDDEPGFWDEGFKGRQWAHDTAGGSLTVVYEHDTSLPVLPTLRAVLESMSAEMPEVNDAVRNLARIARLTSVAIGREVRLVDSIAFQMPFMGADLIERLPRSAELVAAYEAIPPRLRLEIERADTETFLDMFAG